VIAKTTGVRAAAGGDSRDLRVIEGLRPKWALRAACRQAGEGSIMAETRRAERPLSPHLQIYRMQITAISSILIRISGNGIVAGAILAVWWLLAAATSDASFAVADAVVTSWFGKLVFGASLLGVWYHYLGGLRHLYYDAGRGLDIRTAELLGWACVIGSVVLTVLTLFVI
jgi:succinate dehydrogenase / fumarate reductase, cytochrome b subunit